MSFSQFIHTQRCSTMELRASSVLLLFCVTIIILTSTEVDAIPSCCVRVSKTISRSKLCLVSKHKTQRKSGPCDIDALILLVNNKWICADIAVLKRLEKLNQHCKPKRTRAKAG